MATAQAASAEDASSAAVALRGVTKTFGETTAVAGLDVTIPRGTLCGFIGPNGAGKTTLIRLIMSILFPDSGEVRVLGHASALAAKDRIGYLPEERGVYRKMRVGAYLSFIAAIKGVAPRAAPARIQSLLERVGLPDVESKKCEELSKGMLQKVQFAAAIIHEPELLILDEPFSGLDPVSMRLLRGLILAEHARGATILFSTHVMSQAEELCERVVMIHRGAKMLDDPVSVIRSRYDTRALVFEPLGAGADLSAVQAMPEVESCRGADGAYDVVLREGSDVQAAIRRIVATLPVARVALKRPRLEDIFIRLVTGSAAPDGAQDLRAALATAPEEPPP
jgi:ABC-2 type transport system ATP-binding protein